MAGINWMGTSSRVPGRIRTKRQRHSFRQPNYHSHRLINEFMPSNRSMNAKDGEKEEEAVYRNYYPHDYAIEKEIFNTNDDECNDAIKLMRSIINGNEDKKIEAYKRGSEGPCPPDSSDPITQSSQPQILRKKLRFCDAESPIPASSQVKRIIRLGSKPQYVDNPSVMEIKTVCTRTTNDFIESPSKTPKPYQAMDAKFRPNINGFDSPDQAVECPFPQNVDAYNGQPFFSHVQTTFSFFKSDYN